jgi:hypothetical protein
MHCSWRPAVAASPWKLVARAHLVPNVETNAVLCSALFGVLGNEIRARRDGGRGAATARLRRSASVDAAGSRGETDEHFRLCRSA